jgi:predicted histone-like DNA-binding protein
MAFYKRMQKKADSLWHPQSITVGKPVATDEIAEKLAEVSTVSLGDAYNVLKDLAEVMSEYMAAGRTVKLDGLGTFYYTAVSAGNGVETEKLVNAGQITGTRVRFIPEGHRTSKTSPVTRTLVDRHIEWVEWGGKATPTDNGGGDGGSTGGGGGNTGGGGNNSGGSGGEEPLGCSAAIMPHSTDQTAHPFTGCAVSVLVRKCN